MADHDPFAAQDAPDTTTTSARSASSANGDHLDSERLSELKAIADTLGLDGKGNRATLIDRIRAAQARNP